MRRRVPREGRGGVGEGVAVWARGAEGALVAAIDVGRTDEAGDVILRGGGVQGGKLWSGGVQGGKQPPAGRVER